MNIAYLILAHGNPRHLQRLVDALTSRTARFFIHVDRKADLSRFAALERPGVTFCDRRIHCAWGNRSLVDATNVLIDTTLASSSPFDYYVLLSGACYPIKSNRTIEAFLAASDGTEFIQTIPLPNAEYGKPIERLTRYFITRERPFARFKWAFQSWLHRVLPPRDYERRFGALRPVGGSQWWALTHDALVYARRFIDEHAALYDFCRHVDCPDELVFQTALWNSPFREKLGHCLTFTHWTPGKMGPDPIDERLLDHFRSPRVVDSEANNAPGEKREVLFARKFTDASAGVVSELDAIREAYSPDR